MLSIETNNHKHTNFSKYSTLFAKFIVDAVLLLGKKEELVTLSTRLFRL